VRNMLKSTSGFVCTVGPASDISSEQRLDKILSKREQDFICKEVVTFLKSHSGRAQIGSLSNHLQRKNLMNVLREFGGLKKFLIHQNICDFETDGNNGLYALLKPREGNGNGGYSGFKPNMTNRVRSPSNGMFKLPQDEQEFVNRFFSEDPRMKEEFPKLSSASNNFQQSMSANDYNNGRAPNGGSSNNFSQFSSSPFGVAAPIDNHWMKMAPPTSLLSHSQNNNHLARNPGAGRMMVPEDYGEEEDHRESNGPSHILGGNHNSIFKRSLSDPTRNNGRSTFSSGALHSNMLDAFSNHNNAHNNEEGVDQEMESSLVNSLSFL